MPTPTPTPTPIALKNAQDSVFTGFADAGSILGPIAIVFVFLLVLLGMGYSARFYRWVLEASGAFARSVEYAVKGVATTAVIALFLAPFYVFAQLDAGTRSLAYQAVGAVIVGYVGLVVLGYIGERVWIGIAQRHEDVTGHRPFEHWDWGKEEPEEDA